MGDTFPAQVVHKCEAQAYLDAFSQYVTTNMNEIAALKIICTRPKDLTRASLKNLKLALDREGFTTQQLNTAISELTNEEIAADIISLIRRYALGSALISHEARIRRAVDKLFIGLMVLIVGICVYNTVRAFLG